MTDYTLTTGDDTIDAGATGGNTVTAADGTLTSGDKIDAGSGGNNTLDLQGDGFFNLGAPLSLTDIQTVTGEGSANQTILLRQGLPLLVHLSDGQNTVTVANTGDSVTGGSGNNLFYVAADLLGATLDGGTGGFNQLNITGGAASATIGSNVTNFRYVDVQTDGLNLDLGQLAATQVYLDGTNDAVTLSPSVTNVLDQQGGNTVNFATAAATLTFGFVGNQRVSDPLETINNFSSKSAIDFSQIDANDPNVTVSVSFNYTTDQLEISASYFDQPTNTTTQIADQFIQFSGTFYGSFSTQSDNNGGTLVTFSGAIFNPPANPSTTQPVYFIGYADQNTGGLGTSNGTAAGSTLVDSRNNTLNALGFTASDGHPTDAVAGGKLYLLQQNLAGGDAIYVSDGTAAGTALLHDFGSTRETIVSGSLGAMGSGLGFLTVQRTGIARDAVSGNVTDGYRVTLYRSDGTPSGTSAVGSFDSATMSSSPVASYEGSANGYYIFNVGIGADAHLYSSDGSTSHDLADYGASPVTQFTTYSGGAYYLVANAAPLYQTDGTSVTTVPTLTDSGGHGIAQILGTFNGHAVYAYGFQSSANQIAISGAAAPIGTLAQPQYLLASDAAVQVGTQLVVEDEQNLSVSDGSSALTPVTPTGLPTGSTFSVHGNIGTNGGSASLGGDLYFFGNVTTSGNTTVELFKTDGTAAGTALVDDFQGVVTDAYALINADGTLYFKAYIQGATRLFRSDGSNPAYPVPGDSDLLFNPQDLVTGALTPTTAPAPQTDTLTTGADIVTGSAGDDTIVAIDATLSAGDVIDGAGGTNILQLNGNGTFDLRAPATLVNVGEVDSHPAGYSGATQTIFLRDGTNLLVRIERSASTVTGAANTDTIVGTGGINFSSQPTTTVIVGGPGETIDVTNALVRSSTANAGATIISPFSLTLTDNASPAVLNANDVFSTTGGINLAGPTDLSVSGGHFTTSAYVTVNLAGSGSHVSLGSNGQFFINGAGGGDTITEAGDLASYALRGTAAQLQGDTINDFDFTGHHVTTVDVTDFNYATDTVTYTYTGGVLTVVDGARSLTLNIAGDPPSFPFRLQSDFAGGTLIDAEAPCYCRGTLILTASGEVPVEELAIGDLLVTAAGAHRPIRWLGRRAYAGRFANVNPEVLPIRFAAGSLGAGSPRRDLWVSPKHAMFLDGVLIPAEQLVDGIAVTQATRVETVEYFHIELDSHDVIVAEGALSETFVDDRSRAMFHNAREFAALYPDAVPVPAVYCAPRVEDGFALEAVRQRLAGLLAAGPAQRAA